MPDVRLEEPFDLARYGWAKDLLLTFSAIGDHAVEEAETATHGPSAGAPEPLLNLFLLVCAAEQTAADHLARGGLELSSVRRALRGSRIGSASVTALERTSEELCSIRASAFDRPTFHRVEVLRELAMDVGTALARDETKADVDRWKMTQAFSGIEPDLAACRMKIPSCFRAQDLTPADCFELARRFIAESPTITDVLVVGIRTSGSYMAPLVAGWLRAGGIEAGYTTVRPKAPLVGHERQAIKRLRHRAVLVVDDPPMTGGSYLRTAAHLAKCGVAMDSITFLVPIGAESVVDAGTTTPFGSYRRIELPHRELAVRRQLNSPQLLAFIASAAGKRNARVSALMSEEEVERQSRRRHVKQTYAVEGSGRMHVKGVGVGWLGYPARHAASALNGMTPQLLGFYGSLMATRDHPAAPPPHPEYDDVAAYVARRSLALSVPAPTSPRKFQKDGFYRLAKLIARVHGPLAPLAIGGVRRRLAEALHETPACLIDGRMGLEEWVGESGALKRDFEEHAFDKDDLALYDPAYDLAGAILELGPGRDVEDRLVTRYIDMTGDKGVCARLSLSLLLYGAFLMERRSWEVQGELGRAAWPDAVQAWLEAEAGLTWTVGRLFGNSNPHRREGLPLVLWSIDIDGVLEDSGLGFPAMTPAAAEALRHARAAGAAVVLNSGRSLPELILRCDALGLDGAVAEYGSAIWDATKGQSESLLDEDELVCLARVRAAAAALPGVHVDSRYHNSVRLRRFAGGRPTALDNAEIQFLLNAGQYRVRAMRGVRQTDFISSARDKSSGLELLGERLHFTGKVFAVGDAESDRTVAMRATRAYAPRHRDGALAGVAIHLRADRQRALLEAVRREHGRLSPNGLSAPPAGDLALINLFALRDAPRPVRALRAIGPRMLETFLT